MMITNVWTCQDSSPNTDRSATPMYPCWSSGIFGHGGPRSPSMQTYCPASVVCTPSTINVYESLFTCWISYFAALGWSSLSVCSLINRRFFKGDVTASHHWIRAFEPGSPEQWKVASSPMNTALLVGLVTREFLTGPSLTTFRLSAFFDAFVLGKSLNLSASDLARVEAKTIAVKKIISNVNLLKSENQFTTIELCEDSKISN